jgi:hypothetical protein
MQLQAHQSGLLDAAVAQQQQLCALVMRYDGVHLREVKGEKGGGGNVWGSG